MPVLQTLAGEHEQGV